MKSFAYEWIIAGPTIQRSLTLSDILQDPVSYILLMCHREHVPLETVSGTCSPLFCCEVRANLLQNFDGESPKCCAVLKVRQKALERRALALKRHLRPA